MVVLTCGDEKAGRTSLCVLPSFSKFSRLLVKSVLCPVKIHHSAEISKGWLSGKDGIAAESLPAAVLALESRPDSIELVHGGIDKSGFIGQDTCFKVTGPCAFHSDPRASEVGRSDIGSLAVEDNDLEVDTWAEGPFQTGEENRILVKVLPEIGPRFLRMDQPDLFPFLDQVGQDTQKRSVFHLEILDIRRPDPNRPFHFWDQGDDLLEVVPVCNVFRHGNLYHQPNQAIRLHKGFRVGHDNGIDHPSIDRLLIPSGEQPPLVDLLCNLVNPHPAVTGCQDKEYGFFDFHTQIYNFSSNWLNGKMVKGFPHEAILEPVPTHPLPEGEKRERGKRPWKGLGWRSGRARPFRNGA